MGLGGRIHSRDEGFSPLAELSVRRSTDHGRGGRLPRRHGRGRGRGRGHGRGRGRWGGPSGDGSNKEN